MYGMFEWTLWFQCLHNTLSLFLQVSLDNIPRHGSLNIISRICSIKDNFLIISLWERNCFIKQHLKVKTFLHVLEILFIYNVLSCALPQTKLNNCLIFLRDFVQRFNIEKLLCQDVCQYKSLLNMQRVNKLECNISHWTSKGSELKKYTLEKRTGN